MFWFFSKHRAKRKIQYAPGTKIPYRPDLVDKLVSEHHALLLLFREIIRAHSSSNHKRVYSLLIKFKSSLRAHLLKENTYLYMYLKYVTKSDEYNSRIIADMQREMGQIGKGVFSFVQKWTTSSDLLYDDVFLKELKSIGAALVQRIENEEDNLYPYYSEPGTYY